MRSILLSILMLCVGIVLGVIGDRKILHASFEGEKSPASDSKQSTAINERSKSSSAKSEPIANSQLSSQHVNVAAGLPDPLLRPQSSSSSTSSSSSLAPLPTVGSEKPSLDEVYQQVVKTTPSAQ